MKIVESQFLLREKIDDWLSTLKLRAKDKNLDFAVRVEDDVPNSLVGDTTRIRQIVMNLVDNAIKFTADGAVDVRFERLALAAGDSTSARRVNLLCSVTDSGIGMKADQLRLVFLPFEQVDSSMTREFGGTGLGLAISKQLAELMAGRLWAESTAGKGSSFFFQIELAEADG